MRLVLMSLFLLAVGECRLTDHSFSIRVETLAESGHARRQQSGIAFARDDAEWRALWEQAGFDGTPPVIDFRADMVVAYFMGGCGTGGYSASITGVESNGLSVVVRVATWSPGPNCVVTQAPTSPVTLARVARQSAPASQVDLAARTTDCR